MARPPIEVSARSTTLADRAVEAIREMIHDGILLPGHPVRQTVIARQLELSRIPVREALKSLEAEGLVQAAPGGGFAVTRLTAQELDQVYLMRKLLETEMYKHITETPPPQELAELRALNLRMAELVDSSHREIRELNRDFHFRIFNLSGLGYVANETTRLWTQSAPYRSIYVSWRSARERIIGEHEGILDALQAHDIQALITRADAHRSAAQREVITVLSQPVGTTAEHDRKGITR